MGRRKQNNCDVASKQLCSALQNSYMYWQSYLLTFPRAIFPGKLQGGEKEMSEHTSLPLLTEDRYKLNVPFQREKK